MLTEVARKKVNSDIHISPSVRAGAYTASPKGAGPVSMVQTTLFGDDVAPAFDWFGALSRATSLSSEPDWQSTFATCLRRVAPTPAGVRTLSLFSGGGGLDIAFHDLGFEVLEMVEIEPVFAKTLSFHAQSSGRFDGAKVHAVDIRDFQVEKDATYDFIIGGPPCQTFSAAGRRAAGVLGTSDERGTLFAEYVRLLRQLKPKAFLFENVYAILGARAGQDWKQIVQAFREVGYELSWRVLDAADFGVPQHRERLFIIGIRRDLADELGRFKFPRPTHGPDSYSERPHITAHEALRGVPGANENLTVGGRYAHLLAAIPPGLNYSFYTAEMGHPQPVFAWRSKFSDFLYKADPDAPVRTIKAQGGAFTGPLSWKNRHFSSSEIKRLQTFPDDYHIHGSRLQIVHQIGNSVPPQLARILALAVLDQIFGYRPPCPISYLEEDEALGFRTRKRKLTETYQAKARNARSVPGKLSNVAQHPSSNNPSSYFLTTKFDLSSAPKKGALPIATRIRVGRSHIDIDIDSLTELGTCDYELIITSRGEGWTIPIKTIRVSGNKFEPLKITAAFKVVEMAVREKYGIDDLVQLSGYYQYDPRMKMDLTLHDVAVRETKFAQALISVLQGRVVGRVAPTSLLSVELNLPSQEVDEFMRSLKDMGFEVRNARTNSQIPPDSYLIPYAFPTLTSRSVQLRKGL